MAFKFIEKEYAKSLLPVRPKDANKGTFGKVLNIAGCVNYQGAAYLSSLSPLKTGAGLVTLASVGQVVNNLAGAAPWITFLPLKDFEGNYIAKDAFSEIKRSAENYSVISIGSGLSTESCVGEFVLNVVNYLNNEDKMCVIDADALNIIAKSEVKSLPKNAIITPHPMEMSRLLNVPVTEIQADRIKYAKTAAQKFGCTAILKGSGTVICTQDCEVFVNTTGSPAMAKAGSGDVLVGIISGLLAQGLSVKDASVLGVYLHGLCGDLAEKDLGAYSVLSTDLIDYIPKAFKTLAGA